MTDNAKLRYAGNLLTLLVELEANAPLSMGQRWAKFHVENPIVEQIIIRLAREWVDKFGRNKVGIDRLISAARWEIAFTTTDPDFRCNNNNSSWYARWVMLTNEDLAGIFETRRSAADTEDLAALVDEAKARHERAKLAVTA